MMELVWLHYSSHSPGNLSFDGAEIKLMSLELVLCWRFVGPTSKEESKPFSYLMLLSSVYHRFLPFSPRGFSISGATSSID